MNALACLLGGAALAAAGQDPAAPPADPELVFESGDGSFRTRLPRGYRLVKDERKEFHYERAAGTAEWERVHFRSYPGGGEVPQDDPPPGPGELARPASLPSDARFTAGRESWSEFGIPTEAARYVDRERNLEMTAFFARVPLSPRAATLATFAPRVMEKEALLDLRGMLQALEGRTNWQTASQRERQRRSTWLRVAGFGAMGAYFVVWLLFLRGHPMKAHLFRTLSLGSIALLFLGTMVYSGGMLYLLVPCLFYFSMAGRRMKIGIEEGD
jgi:hypothetical protein